jgi:hypothetical protein
MVDQAGSFKFDGGFPLMIKSTSRFGNLTQIGEVTNDNLRQSKVCGVGYVNKCFWVCTSVDLLKA